MHYSIDSRTYSIPSEFYTQPQPSTSFYVELEHWGIINVIGEQAEFFLQGQLTNDVKLASDKTPQKQLLCNIKGQIVAKLLLLKQGSNFQLICPKDLIEPVINLLKKTALLSKVVLTEDSYTPVYGMITNENPSYISLEKPDLPKKEEIYWHYRQLQDKEFSIYPSTSKLFLPHHLSLETQGWISFNKGCYRGQEIIARMHYRGKSKYGIVQWIQQQDPQIQPGSEVFGDNQEKYGEVLDICPITDKDILVIACLKKGQNEFS